MINNSSSPDVKIWFISENTIVLNNLHGEEHSQGFDHGCLPAWSFSAPIGTW